MFILKFNSILIARENQVRREFYRLQGMIYAIIANDSFAIRSSDSSSCHSPHSHSLEVGGFSQHATGESATRSSPLRLIPGSSGTYVGHFRAAQGLLGSTKVGTGPQVGRRQSPPTQSARVGTATQRRGCKTWKVGWPHVAKACSGSCNGDFQSAIFEIKYTFSCFKFTTERIHVCR